MPAVMCESWWPQISQARGFQTPGLLLTSRQGDCMAWVTEAPDASRNLPFSWVAIGSHSTLLESRTNELTLVALLELCLAHSKH